MSFNLKSKRFLCLTSCLFIALILANGEAINAVNGGSELVDVLYVKSIKPEKTCDSERHLLEREARIRAIDKVLGLTVKSEILVKDEVYLASFLQTKSEGIVKLYNIDIIEKDQYCKLTAKATVKPLAKHALSEFNSYAVNIDFPEHRIRITTGDSVQIDPDSFKDIQNRFLDQVSSRFNKKAFTRTNKENARWILTFKPNARVNITRYKTLKPWVTYYYSLTDSISGEIVEEGSIGDGKGEKKVTTLGYKKRLDLTVEDVLGKIADDPRWFVVVEERLKGLTGVEGTQRLIRITLLDISRKTVLDGVRQKLAETPFVKSILHNRELYSPERSYIYFRTDLPVQFLVDEIKEHFKGTFDLESYSDYEVTMRFKP